MSCKLLVVCASRGECDPLGPMQVVGAARSQYRLLSLSPLYSIPISHKNYVQAALEELGPFPELVVLEARKSPFSTDSKRSGIC